jgi:disulfide oxidoreductase YuzD
MAKAKIMRIVVGLTSGLKVSKYHERQTKKKMVLEKKYTNHVYHYHYIDVTVVVINITITATIIFRIITIEFKFKPNIVKFEN